MHWQMNTTKALIYLKTNLPLFMSFWAFQLSFTEGVELVLPVKNILSSSADVKIVVNMCLYF